MKRNLTAFVAVWLLANCLAAQAEGRRKVIIDQDASGPAGSDQQSMMLLIQSPQAEVLGITVVTGDQWLHDEVGHTLRMLEIIGRTDIPVVPGAEFPLVRRRAETERWEQEYGSFPWLGAWTPKFYHPPDTLGDFPEGKPTTRPAEEDAAHFLIRMVHKFPHEVTIYEGGPMTNLALATSIDPGFPALAKELVFMGGSINPRTEDPEFALSPTHEFNLWFDPEAAHIVLSAPWKKVVCTTVDISVKTEFNQAMVDRIKAADTPGALYIGKYTKLQPDYNFLWDELAAAAWLDPTLITKKENLFMDVDLNRGASYGNTLTWSGQTKPQFAGSPVEVQDDLDTGRFYKMVVDLLSGPALKK
jgi:inosine-uridine nucleoside N-ribohydrolase